MKQGYTYFFFAFNLIFASHAYITKKRKTIVKKYCPAAVNFIKNPELCACWNENDYFNAMVLLFGERSSSLPHSKNGLRFKLPNNDEEVFVSECALSQIMTTWKLYKYEAFWKFISNFPDIKERLNNAHRLLHRRLHEEPVSKKGRKYLCDANKSTICIENLNQLMALEKKEELVRLNADLDESLKRLDELVEAPWRDAFKEIKGREDWISALEFMIETVEEDPQDIYANIILKYLFHKIDLYFEEKNEENPYIDLKYYYRDEALKNCFYDPLCEKYLKPYLPVPIEAIIQPIIITEADINYFCVD